MREILFRGKRIDNGKWVFGSLISGIYGAVPVIVTMPSVDDDFRLEVEYDHVDPATVGQYTGLTDKNGKRIFEGDVVRFNYAGKNIGVEGIATVIFENGKFGVKWGWHKDFVCMDGFANTTQEIIGTIHDNPELLKGGET